MYRERRAHRSPARFQDARTTGIGDSGGREQPSSLSRGPRRRVRAPRAHDPDPAAADADARSALRCSGERSPDWRPRRAAQALLDPEAGSARTSLGPGRGLHRATPIARGSPCRSRSTAARPRRSAASGGRAPIRPPRCRPRTGSAHPGTAARRRRRLPSPRGSGDRSAPRARGDMGSRHPAASRSWGCIVSEP